MLFAVAWGSKGSQRMKKLAWTFWLMFMRCMFESTVLSVPQGWGCGHLEFTTTYFQIRLLGRLGECWKIHNFLHLMYDMSLVGVFYILVYWWTVDHAQINVFLGDSLVGYDLKCIVLFFL